MFTLSDEKIKELSEEGIYDYFVDGKDNGKINDDDKDTIYQYCLLYLQESLDVSAAKKFLNGLNEVLRMKSRQGY